MKNTLYLNFYFGLLLELVVFPIFFMLLSFFAFLEACCIPREHIYVILYPKERLIEV